MDTTETIPLLLSTLRLIISHRPPPAPLLRRGQAVEPGEDADHGRGVVRAGLGLHVVPAVVPELVPGVGPADDGAGEDVGVGPPPAEPVVEPLHAADEAAVGLVRDDGGAAVVHADRVPAAVADHVAEPQRVAAQDVVRLRARQGQQLGRRRRRQRYAPRSPLSSSLRSVLPWFRISPYLRLFDSWYLI